MTSSKVRGARLTAAGKLVGVCGLVASLLASVVCLAGCDAALAREFRNAAAPSLQNGLNAIFDGIITGAFATINSNSNSSSGASSNSNSSGG